jgi:hypothetical protein
MKGCYKRVSNESGEKTLTLQTLLEVEEDLKRQGYAILRGIVSTDLLVELNLELSEAYRTGPKFEGGGSILGHLNCYPGEAARFVYDDLRDCGLVDAILAMRSGRRNDILARVNWNLAGSSAQHWHMDGTFVDDFVICNVAVVDVDMRNGPMEVVPGSHSRYYPFWQFVLERRNREAVPVLLEQGDVLVRLSTLWHRGTPNLSDVVRPLMSVSFGEDGAPTGDPFQVSGGGIRFYPNWYRNSSRLDIYRERVEKAFPITRSAGRLAKSLLRPRGYDSY